MNNGARDAFQVFLDDEALGGLQCVGTLYRSSERSDLPASFVYDPVWRKSRHAFLLDPRLELLSTSAEISSVVSDEISSPCGFGDQPIKIVWAPWVVVRDAVAAGPVAG